MRKRRGCVGLGGLLATLLLPAVSVASYCYPVQLEVFLDPHGTAVGEFKETRVEVFDQDGNVFGEHVGDAYYKQGLVIFRLGANDAEGYNAWFQNPPAWMGLAVYAIEGSKEVNKGEVEWSSNWSPSCAGLRASDLPPEVVLESELASQMASELEKGLAPVSASISTLEGAVSNIGSAQASLAASLDQKVAEIAAGIPSQIAAISAAVDQKISSAIAGLSAGVDVKLSNVQSSVAAQLPGLVNDAIAPVSSSLNQQIADLQSAVAANLAEIETFVSASLAAFAESQTAYINTVINQDLMPLIIKLQQDLAQEQALRTSADSYLQAQIQSIRDKLHSAGVTGF